MLRYDDRPADFRQEARYQKVCAICGKPGGGVHGHHVIDRQELRRRNLPEWDHRNALRVHPFCPSKPLAGHYAHENARDHSRIPLSRLTDKNVEFAAEALGDYAYDHLTRYYSGTDERVEALRCH